MCYSCIKWRVSLTITIKRKDSVLNISVPVRKTKFSNKHKEKIFLLVKNAKITRKGSTLLGKGVNGTLYVDSFVGIFI